MAKAWHQYDRCSFEYFTLDEVLEYLTEVRKRNPDANFRFMKYTGHTGEYLALDIEVDEV
jgi:hypothetical protein